MVHRTWGLCNTQSVYTVYAYQKGNARFFLTLTTITIFIIHAGEDFQDAVVIHITHINATQTTERNSDKIMQFIQHVGAYSHS